MMPASLSRCLVVLNPWAGRGSAGRQRPALERALRAAAVDYTLVITDGRGAATVLAQHGVAQGCAQIIAVGGDGTINEVVNGIKRAERSGGRRAQLGIVPLGTGSDFVKSVHGVDKPDIAGAVRRIAGERTQAVDVGYVQVDEGASRYFINGMGMGFDAQAAAEALNIRRLKGAAVYVVAILRALAHYKASPMTVRYADSLVKRRLLFATVANGRCQAGGFWLTPNALVDDGLLDLCIVDTMRVDEILRHLPKVRHGQHTHLRQVTMGRASTIQVECESAMPVATDGEVIATAARRVLIETLPGALDVIV